MAPVVIHSSAEFRKALEDAGPRLVVVQFHATWCGPCRRISPEFLALSKDMKDVVFLKVDVDECKALAAESQVSSVPLFHLFRSGEKVSEVRGADSDALRSAIKAEASKVGTIWGTGGRRLGDASSSSSARPSTSTSSSADEARMEARRRAAEAAARRFAAQSGVEVEVDTDKVGTASTVVPDAEADDEDDDEMDVAGGLHRGSVPSGTSPARASKPAEAIRVNQDFLEQIIAMGFSRGAAVRGLQEVKNAGVAPAMDWILAHPGEEGEEPAESVGDVEPMKTEDGQSEGSTAASGADGADVAEGTKMEVEPERELTDEEKRELAAKKAAELRAQIEEKKKLKKIQEEKEAIEREKKRRQDGKSFGKLKEELEYEKMQKEMAEAKRLRQEEKAHRRKIAAQIKADKEARKAKALAAKGGAATTSPAPVVTPAPAAPVAVKEYSECTIQVRFQNGSTSTEKFPVTSTIGDVFARFELDSSMKLMSTFPRRQYSTPSDMKVTLKEADMVPRGQLIVQFR